MRVGQGVGGALVFANSSAILTDAFPQHQRGLALGVNSIAMVVGSFLGLVLGGVLGAAALAARLPRLGADRRRRDRLVVLQPPRARHPQAGPDRLVGERDLRRSGSSR